MYTSRRISSARPEVLKTREIPANHVNYLRVLEAVSRDELEIGELERLIKSEASVLYCLLRYWNSPIFAFANEIHSVRHALSILGETRDTSLDPTASPGLGGGRSGPVTWFCPLWCARFCERLATKGARSESETARDAWPMSAA